MRTLFALFALCLCAADLGAAERFTATSGASYTRAKDGHFYPSEYVRADGTVAAPTAKGCPCDVCPCQILSPGVPCPAACPCAGGACATPAKVTQPAARRIVGYRQQCVNGTCQLVPVYAP